MSGPQIAEQIDEVRGQFTDPASLDEAMQRLTVAGFDRAELSLPTDDADVKTPDQGAAAPITDADQRQVRTLGTSGAAAATALAAAGATIATGGAAAVAIAAAIAGGVGAGAATYAGLGAADSAGAHERQDAASKGTLVLAVRLVTPARRLAAERALREAGAHDIWSITRRVAS